MGRVLSTGVALCLLAAVTGMPVHSVAAEQVSAVKMPEKTVAQSPVNAAISLEKAIIMAKEKVPLPEGLDLFNSDYQEDNGKGHWNLRWSSSKGNMEFTISVDTMTGVVENVSYYKNIEQNVRYKGLPLYTKAQCLDIARKEGARILPDRFAGTELNNQEQFDGYQVLGDREYPVLYNFNFRRTVHGIPVVDQGINVGINADTGEVIRFDSTWDDTESLPGSAGMLSAHQATAIFKEKSGYELTYFVTPSENPDVPGDIKLVYRFKTPGRFVINALSGESFDQNVYFNSDDMSGGGGGDRMLGSKEANEQLTPMENKAVEETKGYISADKAQEITAGLVEIPQGYAIHSRNLERNYGVPGSRLWNLQYANQEKNAYFWVALNAKNGELVSFSRDYPAEPFASEQETQLSKEDARKIADGLIQKLQPTKMGQVVLRQVDPEMAPWLKRGVYQAGAYNFQYARMVNGVVYPENGFNVRVSAVDGEVISYHLTWWDTGFPNPSPVVGTASINDRFLAEYPLKLEYSRGYFPYKEQKQPDYYLIYRTFNGEVVMFDALTGQQIDYQGKPVVKKNQQPFSDIAGHSAEADIKLLAQEGIVNGDGGKFRPDDQATVAEALAMLDKAYGNRYYYPLAAEQEPWYKQVLESTKAKGILDFEVNPEAGLSRLQLSRLGVNAKGWGTLAGLYEIFKLEIPDASLVSKEERGYAAAVVGLKLLPLENGKFNPQGKMTRAQVAVYLVNLLKQ